MVNTETGASAVEYGLIVTAIAGTIATAVFFLGPPVHGLFADTCTSVSERVSDGTCD